MRSEEAEVNPKAVNYDKDMSLILGVMEYVGRIERKGVI